MRESWNPGTIVDDQGRPLVNGRVTVHVHDSYAIADIYTYEGDEYIPAPNPQYLDENGRLSATLFADLGVYDVEVQKANGDGTYEDFDNFEFGIDAKLDDWNRTEVDTVEDLADLDPTVSSQVVTVRSYPRRSYLWDAGSVDTPDGGIVVESNVEGQGNWILLWDCPYLPSSVYGVKPSDISNLGAFLTYPDYVGSMSMRTPQCVLLEQGAYALGTVVCNKRLAIDKNTSWTGQIRTNQDVEVMGSQTAAIGDIYFTKPGCTAHSAWYPSVESFWHCGADTFVVDSSNYFTGTTLSTYADLSGKTVMGHGTQVTAYANSAAFRVNSASSVPDGFFGKDDYVVLLADIGDKVFAEFSHGSWDPGLISAGHHQQYMQTPSLDKFIDADRWVAVMLERKQRLTTQMGQVLDLQGRAIKEGVTLLADAHGFLRLHNALVGGDISLYGAHEFRNVSGSVLAVQSSTLTAHSSNLNLDTSAGGKYTYLEFDDCEVRVNPGLVLDPSDTAIYASGGSFYGTVKKSDANTEAYIYSQPVVFQGVRITAPATWRVSTITMRNCECAAKIDLMPMPGSDSYYYWTATFVENRFTENARIWFGACFASGDSHTELDGRMRLNLVRIVGNDFGGSDAYGIKMMKYNPSTYNMLMAADTGIWEYRRNTGKCPLVSVGAVPCGAGWSTVQSGVNIWKVYSAKLNIFCPYNNYGDGSYHLAQDGTGTGVSNVQVPYALWANLIGGKPETYAYAYGGVGIDIASINDEDDNNLFIVKLAVGSGVAGVAPPALDSGNVWFPAPGVA